MSAQGRHSHRLQSGHGDRGLGTVHRLEYRRVSRPGAFRILQRRFPLKDPITKTGNSHARRLLVEAAWHHRKRYRVGATIQARWQSAPAAARALGRLGNQRLNRRWETFTAHHIKPVVANVAVARGLAGWCWSLAALPD